MKFMPQPNHEPDPIENYRAMWMEDNHDYWLVGTKPEDFAIYKVSRNGFLTIENDDVGREVVQKLLAANTRIVSSQEFNQYFNTIVSDSSDLVD